MKINPRHMFVPAAIAAVCSAVLAHVHHATRSFVEDGMLQKERLAARLVLPDGLPEPVKTNINGVVCLASFGADGALLAAALEGVSPNGYGGEIRVMAGFTADGVLHDFKVLSANETPGLGSKISSGAFRSPLRGRPVSAGWFLKQDGGEVDAITAATVSSRAALEALRDAMEKLNNIR